MQRKRGTALGSVLLMLLVLVACGGTQEEAIDPNTELWNDIESRRAAIDKSKAEVEELKAQLKAMSAEAAEGAID